MVKEVEIINFPDPQNVTGSVTVANEPLTVQSGVDPVEVSGQVAVTNLPACEAPSRFQLVGFTSATFDGGAGIFGFTKACQVEFPGSRMCTSVEAMETVVIPLELAGSAWLRPIYMPISSDSARNIALDASGVYLSILSYTPFSCGGWTDGAGTSYGLTINSNGGFTVAKCDQLLSTACCAPVP
jgi:hypothetical protein